jgi:hypothetical protein
MGAGSEFIQRGAAGTVEAVLIADGSHVSDEGPRLKAPALSVQQLTA